MSRGALAFVLKRVLYSYSVRRSTHEYAPLSLQMRRYVYRRKNPCTSTAALSTSRDEKYDEALDPPASRLTPRRFRAMCCVATRLLMLRGDSRPPICQMPRDRRDRPIGHACSDDGLTGRFAPYTAGTPVPATAVFQPHRRCASTTCW